MKRFALFLALCLSGCNSASKNLPPAPGPTEVKTVVDGHHTRERVQWKAVESIDILVTGTAVEVPVKAQTSAILRANEAASAAQIDEMLTRFAAVVAALESGKQADAITIAELRHELEETKKNFADSVRKWIVTGLYALAVVCVGLAILRFKAALTTGLAPFAALKSGAFLLGTAGSLVSLAKLVGAWWFEYACYAVAASVVGWIAYTLWKEQRLAQAARAARAVVKRLDAAYESASADTQTALDTTVFAPLSEEMKHVPGAKAAIHLLRAN